MRISPEINSSDVCALFPCGSQPIPPIAGSTRGLSTQQAEITAQQTLSATSISPDKNTESHVKSANSLIEDKPEMSASSKVSFVSGLLLLIASIAIIVGIFMRRFWQERGRQRRSNKR